MIEITTLIVGQMATNCYLLSDPVTHEAAIVDPGDDAEYISDTVFRLHMKPIMIIATHGHFDHIMAAYALTMNYRIPFCIHGDDLFLVDRMEPTARHYLGYKEIDPKPAVDNQISEGQIFMIGNAPVIVCHTPGHTPGSVCLEIPQNNTLLSGDTIFASGAVGRTDYAYGSPAALKRSIGRILSYPKKTRILPGHGQETSVAAEKAFHGV